MRNLLIVNADDWGIDEPTTEAALLCFDAGAVTSVSAMVFMAGSQAGSRLALARGVPAGLHINLT
ncbi:MAG: ChbG/HpnK family deacetylase, partial [Solirubrobacteraceae bacterium]